MIIPKVVVSLLMVSRCIIPFDKHIAAVGTTSNNMLSKRKSLDKGSLLSSKSETQHVREIIILHKIRRPNSLKTVPNGVANCRNVPFAGERGRRSRVRFPKEERCAELPPTFICGKRRKNRRKPVKMKILSSGVVFTFEEGISTSHVCPKGQQPIF